MRTCALAAAGSGDLQVDAIASTAVPIGSDSGRSCQCVVHGFPAARACSAFARTAAPQQKQQAAAAVEALLRSPHAVLPWLDL